ncbi:MAG: hypothetical protein NTV39_01670 [Candidatus Saccharibacteria bacterium]|nr:hypothetical protein [Candidatus Saccharibacteria bacterium]
MQVHISDLARVAEVHMEPYDRFDDPSLFPELLKLAKVEAGQHPMRDNSVVTFTLGGIDVRVTRRSPVYTMERDYKRSLQGFTYPIVGPTPKQNLSKADYRNDSLIEAANLRLDGAPDLQIRVRNTWEEPFLMGKPSVYDRAMLALSTRLGRTLQDRMDRGEFDPSDADSESVARVAIQTGMPIMEFDDGCRLFKYALERLMDEWEYRNVLRGLFVRVKHSKLALADVYARIQSGPATT